MIDKTQACHFCGVEICFAHGLVGYNHVFCSDECADSYLSTKQPLHCPFCGLSVQAHDYKTLGWSIECRNLKCPVQPETKGFYQFKAQGIQAWNIRSTD